MVDMSRTYAADPRTACIVCHVEIPARDNLTLHMAHHLERIAVFALPRNASVTPDDGTTGSQVRHGLVTERIRSLPDENSAGETHLSALPLSPTWGSRSPTPPAANPDDVDMTDASGDHTHSGSDESSHEQKPQARYKCGICHKRFFRRYNLRAHWGTHPEMWPFVCNVCCKVFARQYDRIRHESAHSSERRLSARASSTHKSLVVVGGEITVPMLRWFLGAVVNDLREPIGLGAISAASEAAHASSRYLTRRPRDGSKKAALALTTPAAPAIPTGLIRR
jgi:hypothetical protein